MIRGTPGRTQFVPGENGPQQAPSERWSVAGNITTKPVVSDGTVLVANSTPGLDAFNAADGTTNWTFTPDVGRQSLPPAVADGTVFYGVYSRNDSESSDRFYAIDLASGETKWSKSADDLEYSFSLIGSGIGPMPVEDAVAVKTENRLYVFNQSEGTVRWNKRYREFQPMAVANGTLFIPHFSDGWSLTAARLSDGTELWTKSSVGSKVGTVRGGVVATSNHVLLSTEDTLKSFSPTSGKLRWESEKGAFAPTVTDNAVYRPTGYSASGVGAYALTDGTAQWTKSGNEFSGVSVEAATSESVYVLAEKSPYEGEVDGKLIALAREDGSKRWSMPLTHRPRYATIVDNAVFTYTFEETGPNDRKRFLTAFAV